MTLRETARLLASCFLAVGLLADRAEADGAGGGSAAPVALRPDALEWRAVPGFPGMIARVWGPADGPQARFIKLPANAKLPLHEHTATVRVVVVSGTYVYGLQGEPERRYEAGSFVVTPGGTAHVAGCSDACVYFEELDAKPDFIPVPAKR